VKFNKVSKNKKSLVGMLDLTPIIDVVFNLLIFFALTLNFAVTSGGINIKLPKASSAEPVKAEQLTINLTEDEKLYLNDKAITFKDLVKKLKDYKDKESLVIIRADDSVTHGNVVRIMDAAKSEGFSKLAIAVQQAEDNK